MKKKQILQNFKKHKYQVFEFQVLNIQTIYIKKKEDLDDNIEPL